MKHRLLAACLGVAWLGSAASFAGETPRPIEAKSSLPAIAVSDVAAAARLDVDAVAPAVEAAGAQATQTGVPAAPETAPAQAAESRLDARMNDVAARLTDGDQAALADASPVPTQGSPSSRFPPRPDWAKPGTMWWRTAPMMDFDSMVMAMTEGWSIVLSDVYSPIARAKGMNEAEIRKVLSRLDALGIYGFDLLEAFKATGSDVNAFLAAADDGTLLAKLDARKALSGKR